MHPWSLSVLPSSSVSTLTWNWPLNHLIVNKKLRRDTYIFQFPRGRNACRTCRSCHHSSYKILVHFPGFLNLSKPLVTPSSVFIILCRGHTAVINWAVDTRHNSGLHFLRNFQYIVVRSSIKLEKKRAIWKIWLETILRFKNLVCTIKITWHARNKTESSPAFITSLLH